MRLIYSIDIQLTLWLVGTFNVLIKTVHLISIMGNHGTFNKHWTKIVIDRDFLYHILYLAFCGVGLCLHPLFYSILVGFRINSIASISLITFPVQLLNVVYQEETLKNVIRSVTRNGRSIILTALLALILVYLFSIIGYLFFRDDFLLEVDSTPPAIPHFREEEFKSQFIATNDSVSKSSNQTEQTMGGNLSSTSYCAKMDCPDGATRGQSVLMSMMRTGGGGGGGEDSAETDPDEEDPKERACDSLLMCIITTLNHGLRNGGGIGDVLRSPSSGESLFVARVIYDLLFFFIVIIIILNLIFGVIIDTFADLRSEKQQKEEILKNTCFICGKKPEYTYLEAISKLFSFSLVQAWNDPPLTTRVCRSRSTSGVSTTCGTICTLSFWSK